MFWGHPPLSSDCKTNCRTTSTEILVFEEGYFRPYLVTLEQHGVNALSHLPQQATFFLKALPKLAQQHYQAPPKVSSGFWVNACPAMRYYYQARRGQQHYPHYIHHRAYSVRFYCKNWFYSVAKRVFHWSYEWIFNHKVKQGKLGRFYIVPLQVSTDSQIRFHSDFSSVQSFLMQTMASFALYAPKDSKLIIKHHPMDRASPITANTFALSSKNILIANIVFLCTRCFLT